MTVIPELTGRAVQWQQWSLPARLVTTDPDLLDAARALLTEQLAEVDAADAELRRVAAASGRPVVVGRTLLDLAQAALAAAVVTGGEVDPTRGSNPKGQVQRFAHAPGVAVRLVRSPAPGWQRVVIDRAASTLAVPDDVALDLDVIRSAWAADRCARHVAAELGCGVLVSIGGDIATAGPAPQGWSVVVQDLPDDAAALVDLPAGACLSTVSSRKRRWVVQGRVLDAVLDPRGATAPVWGAVSVVADSCVQASTWGTAALARGPVAPGLLAGRALPARLVSRDGADVVFTGGWPADAEAVTAAQAAGAGIG